MNLGWFCLSEQRWRHVFHRSNRRVELDFDGDRGRSANFPATAREGGSAFGLMAVTCNSLVSAGHSDLRLDWGILTSS